MNLADLYVPPQGRTMHDKLKGYEREMEPIPPTPYRPGGPDEWLRGMDMLQMFKEQLLRPPVDLDQQQMPSQRNYAPLGQLIRDLYR